MDPANLKARLAPRSAWQAMDLGTRFYRHWWWQASLIWVLVTALPYGLLTTWAIVGAHVWPMLLFWWLKPLWERPLLAFFSHALFAEYPGPLTLLRRFPRYGLNGLAGQLLWRRLSPARGYLTGVWQLEGSRGEQAQRRLRALKRAPGQRAGTLTTLVLTLEQLLSIALLVFFLTVAPWQFNLQWSAWIGTHENLNNVLSALAWFLTLSITEPLYVAASFSLYLNERTRMEGWDLQLGLARIGQRRRSHARLPLAVAALLVAGMLMMPNQPARAASPPDPQQQAEQLLASPQFMPMEMHSERRLRADLRGEGSNWFEKLIKKLLEHHPQPHKPNDSLWQMPDWLASVALLLLVLAFGWAAIRLWRGRRPTLPGRLHTAKIPVTVAGLDTSRAALPDDLPRAVTEALEREQIRAALALLLRHALVTLFERHPVRLRPGATEQDCLQAYRERLGATAPVAHLQALTDAWTRTAWAHRPVSTATVRALLNERHQLRASTTEARA